MSERLSTEALARLEERARAATPGPWMWAGHVGHSIELRTKEWGQLVVMGARRAGMQEAEPTFQVYDRQEGEPSTWWGRMVRARDLAVKQAEYRTDVAHIDNPDAAYIAAASPDVVLAMCAEVRRLRRLRDDVQALLDDAWTRLSPEAEETLKEAIARAALAQPDEGAR